jgi:hypothetical protein
MFSISLFLFPFCFRIAQVDNKEESLLVGKMWLGEVAGIELDWSK